VFKSTDWLIDKKRRKSDETSASPAAFPPSLPQQQQNSLERIMSRYDPARDCFTSDPPPTPVKTTVPPSVQAQSSPNTEPPSSFSDPSKQDTSSSPLPPDNPEQAQYYHSTHDHRHNHNHNAYNHNHNRREQQDVSPSNYPPPSTRNHNSSPENVTRKRKALSPENSNSPEPRKPANTDGGPPAPSSQGDLPKIKRRRGTESTRRGTQPRYRYHSPPPPIIPKAVNDYAIAPVPLRQPSPPRQRKRPGAASRLSEKEKDIARQTILKREEEERQKIESQSGAEKVQELVRSHYNDKKELGKQWRQTSSKIKGLRSFNNWVKSTLIHRFSPNDNFDLKNPSSDPNDHLVILDMGCGKGGDLLKWKNAPQEIGFYLGVDTADVSIAHAHDRYDSMLNEQQRGGGRGRGGVGSGSRGRPVFKAEFHAMDCWTHRVDEIPIAQRIGFEPAVGPGPDSRMAARFGTGGGFDVVSMMFCMHYAFETEAKCRNMLRNVAGSLKRGGRFIGTIPSSDIISDRVRGTDPRDTLPEDETKGVQEWGNSIYRVKFAEAPPRSGTFRPPWGWKYNFFLEEAVEEVPEYVVPWEAFRGYVLKFLFCFFLPFHLFICFSLTAIELRRTTISNSSTKNYFTTCGRMEKTTLS
jgi:mRNA (guanine-N7-)-methyltransferase